MVINCIIPARMESSRFPGKPLAKILGREMILRVMDQAHKAKCFERVICATDSQEIKHCVESNGFEAILTPNDFRTGSDRVHYVAQKLNLQYIVNLQGDEPLVDPNLLKSIKIKLEQYPNFWVTAATSLESCAWAVKSEVKVRVEGDEALDFQRIITENDGKWFSHRGIYGYSLKNLDFFCQSPQTNEEKTLSLEQLRIFKTTTFKVVINQSDSVGVDRPEDIIQAEKVLRMQQSRK